MAKVKVDESVCICCGSCIANHGDIFDYSDAGCACVKANANLEDEAGINMAIEECPVGAISKENKEA